MVARDLCEEVLSCGCRWGASRRKKEGSVMLEELCRTLYATSLEFAIGWLGSCGRFVRQNVKKMADINTSILVVVRRVVMRTRHRTIAPDR
jgi:hypothetical protein